MVDKIFFFQVQSMSSHLFYHLLDDLVFWYINTSYVIYELRSFTKKKFVCYLNCDGLQISQEQNFVDFF